VRLERKKKKSRSIRQVLTFVDPLWPAAAAAAAAADWRKAALSLEGEGQTGVVEGGHRSCLGPMTAAASAAAAAALGLHSGRRRWRPLVGGRSLPPLGGGMRFGAAGAAVAATHTPRPRLTHLYTLRAKAGA